MISNKKKGYLFEKMLLDILKEAFPDGIFHRVVLSGAVGTFMGIESLKGDVKGSIHKDLPEFSFVFEAKAGYGGTKQITLKREWFAQAREAAELDQIPCVALKFDKAKKNNIVVCMTLEDFIELMRRVIKLYNQMSNILEECNEAED